MTSRSKRIARNIFVAYSIQTGDREIFHLTSNDRLNAIIQRIATDEINANDKTAFLGFGRSKLLEDAYHYFRVCLKQHFGKKDALLSVDNRYHLSMKELQSLLDRYSYDPQQIA